MAAVASGATMASRALVSLERVRSAVSNHTLSGHLGQTRENLEARMEADLKSPNCYAR